MSVQRVLRIALIAAAALILGACTGLQRSDPIQVSVAGIEPLQGGGLELRMMVKLRVQNPNDAPLDYDGVYVKLDVMDKTFATGVSDERGTVPRFGEAIISVPVTVSMLRMLRHALGMLGGAPPDKITYRLSGKLSGPGLATRRFQAQGEFAMPAQAEPAGDTVPP